MRHWRRFQAVLLRADGRFVKDVAQALGCAETSVYNWTAAWREGGVDGVAEGKHPGQARRLTREGEGALEALLSEGDPQAHGYAATGWTVPRHAHGTGPAGLSRGRTDHPPHAAAGGLALEAPEVRARPTRPGLRREKKPSLSKRQPWWRRAARSGSATRRRGASSRRCGRRGHAAASSGWWSSRGATPGAWCMERSTSATGEFVSVVRERSRQDDCVAFLETLGPAAPRGAQAAGLGQCAAAPPQARSRPPPAASHVTLVFLPFRAPELMPCEDLWRLTKAVVAANRAYEAVQEQAERARRLARRPDRRLTAYSKVASSAQSFSGYLLS